jgi:DNA (cytosine-5)-methyltransferase 1
VLQGKPFLVGIDQRGSGDHSAWSLDKPINTICTENRHALAAPVIAQIGQRHGRGQRSAADPLSTITATERHALVAAFIAKHNGGAVGQDLHQPMHTIAGHINKAIVGATLITTGHGERVGQAPRVPHLDKPLGTVVSGANNHALVAAFLVSYYGSGGQGQPLSEPMHTVVTKARHGLVTMTIEGEEYALVDIGMRMLRPRELARAQGFPDSYRLEGTQSEQIARIGNSVCPPVAAALVRANLPSASDAAQVEASA